MAVTYSAVGQPIWICNDQYGQPLSGGLIFTYSSLGPDSVLKDTYADSGGNITNPNPIQFRANGMLDAPIYFSFNSATPNDLYFVRVTTLPTPPIPPNQPGDTIFTATIDPSNGGGGSVVTNYVSINNYITNGEWWRNIGSVGAPGSAIPTPYSGALYGIKPFNYLPIAPSNHSLFSFPDINYVRNTSSTDVRDQIIFDTFPSGTNPLIPDVTTEYFLQYIQSIPSPANDNTRGILIPIQPHVNSLDGEKMTVSLWTFNNSTTSGLITLYWYQYYGSGGTASLPDVTQIDLPINATPSWNKFYRSSNVPSTSGKTISPTGDDGLYLYIEFSLGQQTNVSITKPCLYLGTVQPQNDFSTYDQIDSIINSPRTGDIKITLTSSPLGYVPMNDGTIGNASSGSTTRANIDTWPLFRLIWEAVNNNTYAPIFNSDGTPSTYGGSSYNDFVANKRLSLTKALGRVLAGVNAPTHPLGQFLGVETHTLTASEIPTHDHQPASVNISFISQPVGGGGARPYAAAISTTPVSTTSFGGGQPMSLLQPTTYMNIHIKL